MPHVSEVVARALLPHVSRVFGIMGNGNAYFVDALERLDRGIVPVRHEVATVASADAFQRVSGELAAATTTYGPGYTNTLTALAEAAMARVPLVFVVGGAPSAGMRLVDIDQAAVSEILGAPTIVATPENAGTATINAVDTALRERRPVVVEIPYDLADVEVTSAGAEIPERDSEPQLPSLEPAALEEIAAALNRAERPLILAGRGARQGQEQVRALATVLRADVATTAPTRGLFNGGEGYRDLGVCGGFAAPGAAAAIRSADVVLVLGAGLNNFTMHFGHAFGENATVLQIGLEEAATHERVDAYYRADAGAAAAALLQQVTPSTREPESIEGLLDRDPGAALAPDGLLDPRSLATRLNEIIPRERVVVSDGGHFIGWANMYFDLPAADSMVLLGTGFLSIGLGFSSAVGAAEAAGEKVTVLVTGDGGGVMALADAESFFRTAQRGVVVVFNDSAYGAEVHQYGYQGLSETPMMIDAIDFAGVARALGAQATTVNSLEDLDELAAWLDSGQQGTWLVDCRVSREVIAPYMLESTGR